MSHVRVRTMKTLPKTMTTELKSNYGVEMSTSDVEKNKNRHKQNFEDEAKNLRLDKEDTQRSNLNR